MKLDYDNIGFDGIHNHNDNDFKLQVLQTVVQSLCGLSQYFSLKEGRDPKNIENTALYKCFLYIKWYTN